MAVANDRGSRHQSRSRACNGGDPNALASPYDRYGSGYLISLILRVVRDAGTPEDLPYRKLF